ncbi:MAG: hypothetical protein HYX28_08935 [Candidatus Koribacter versatilis]|uniref:Uncharacterized protein n=1 Tax=Candidatus Korobacter versatilis TaxID=658062 RepID=A0A932AAZ1_9BACT|nr:hypothetical protein [Candidatus Koribacter versatilis]
MRKFSLPLLALAVCLTLSGTALAKGDKGNKGGSHGNGQGNSAQHSNGQGHDAYGNRPPGWDKGKKTGWGDCDVPPGQAKKQGCNSTSSAHRGRDRNRHRASTGSLNPGTHPTYTRGHTTTTRPVTTNQHRQNPGGNSAIILQNNGRTTKGTAQKPAVGPQVKERKPAANPN